MVPQEEDDQSDKEEEEVQQRNEVYGESEALSPEKEAEATA